MVTGTSLDAAVELLNQRAATLRQWAETLRPETGELGDQTPWQPDYAIAFLDPVAPALTDHLRG